MPIISVSRGTFSGGKHLAEQLAQDLNYPCISREVIAGAAKLYGVSEASLSAAIARAPSCPERFQRDRDRYLSCIRSELCEHSLAGNLVYHGHAGHRLLVGIRHVIRVRVVADMTYRVRTTMERLRLTERQATAHIHKVDRERRKWTQFLYGIDWGDPSNYDAVLNIQHLGVAGACAVLLRLNELEQFQPTPESERAIQCLTLSSRTIAALAKDEQTRDGDFKVSLAEGVVTITGTVGHPTMAEAAGRVAAAVPGVREVINKVVTPGRPT
jgi:cytidylate kinase